MKKIIILSLSIFTFLFAAYSQEKINVVVIGAHPDDCDIDAGGTALKYAQMGHRVLFVSLTNGDAGHHEKGGGALARIRRAEAQEAGKRLGVSYLVLDNHDAELMPTLENRHEIIRIIREWKADVVISHRPYDYHPDHRNAALLVQDAAFLVVVPNVVSDVPALKRNPVFLYSHDSFQKPSPFKPDIAVETLPMLLSKKFTGWPRTNPSFLSGFRGLTVPWTRFRPPTNNALNGWQAFGSPLLATSCASRW